MIVKFNDKTKYFNKKMYYQCGDFSMIKQNLKENKDGHME